MIRRSTVAMRRKITPGTKKVRDAMWESEEREEEEGVWKFIPAIYVNRARGARGENGVLTSCTSICGRIPG